ncbi:immunity protein Tsi6 family protein [Treponema sp. J25]|jgi:hypothetical protein|uniref:immunity protein Tsi6 family protein n=1 Tax=Treponema sp. J25 TaxID=2094121 RepID=UPI001053407B|nr:immunity protein Tsi6 family protein [Treponema sp. J25]TCW60400.1 hypothetical protein C5O22_11730 [Treponema sp. J25]
MIDSLNQKSLVSDNHQHIGLSRLVIDQWPLGHKLGTEISNLEEEYMALYNFEELTQLVREALNMTNERLRKSPEWQTLQVIQKQLIAIEEDLKNQGASKDELKKRINIGLISVREFEADDPDFTDLLQKIDYRYKKL